MVSNGLSGGSRGGAGVGAAASDARLSQRRFSGALDGEHRLGRTQHAVGRFHHFGKEAVPPLQEVQQCADAEHAAPDVDGDRDALGPATGLPRQSRMRADAV